MILNVVLYVVANLGTPGNHVFMPHPLQDIKCLLSSKPFRSPLWKDPFSDKDLGSLCVMFHPLQVIRGLISSDEFVDHQGTPYAFQFIMSFICQKHLNATPTYISFFVWKCLFSKADRWSRGRYNRVISDLCLHFYTLYPLKSSETLPTTINVVLHVLITRHVLWYHLEISCVYVPSLSAFNAWNHRISFNLYQ